MKTILLALSLVCSPAHASTGNASIFVTATIEVDPRSIQFVDDLDFKLLDVAIQRQLNAFDRSVSLGGKVKYGDRTFQKSVLRDSLVLFQEIARQTDECMLKMEKASCFQKFNEAIQTRFRIFRPREGDTRFTAYYSPDFKGSLTKRGPYQIPLYSAPEDPVLKESTREQIHFEGALEGKGLECAYLDTDLFDLYHLQIEGGGRIHLVDESGKETLRYISYDGKNSHPLRFFSKLMVENGYLAASRASHANQHRYFLEHPEAQRKLYSQSPSYVYFKLTDDEPLGIDSIPLTERRSLAFDRAHHPGSGVLNFVELTVGGKTITRFMLGQDVGGAIKGSARADLYFGFGEEAREAAQTLGAKGRQFFLLKRENDTPIFKGRS
ncbi:MAG: MltA domain-containing protein [Bdellovibrionales bacterium]|nr:MltA domain-containing protein [Bdellovibrionales bacterium]